jgi:hypothetical protein
MHYFDVEQQVAGVWDLIVTFVTTILNPLILALYVLIQECYDEYCIITFTTIILYPLMMALLVPMQNVKRGCLIVTFITFRGLPFISSIDMVVKY